MSDYPKGGDIPTTRAWLDRKGFNGVLVGWGADAILGLEKPDILQMEDGLRLWGYPRQIQQSKLRIDLCVVLICFHFDIACCKVYTFIMCIA